MARPQKSESEKTTHKVQFRTTADEKKRMEQLASEAGLSLTDLIKKAVFGKAPKQHKPTPDRSVFLKGLAELGKIGSNVNQIARALNRRAESEGVRGLPDEVIAHALHGVTTMTQSLRQILENSKK
jgi:hypothetical protein